MSFIINNNDLSLSLVTKNGHNFLVLLTDDTKPEIWNNDPNGHIKSQKGDLYIDVEDNGIYGRQLINGRVGQLWRYDRGRICNAFNSDWVLGCNGTQIIAGQFSLTPNSSAWKLIPIVQSQLDTDIERTLEYEDVDEDDFVIVPIPDCFDQNLPARKEATKVLVFRSKDFSIDNNPYSPLDHKICNKETDIDKTASNDNNNDMILPNDADKLHNLVDKLCSNESNVDDDETKDSDVLVGYGDDVKDSKINYDLDPFEDANDSLEASTLKVFASVYSMANKFLGKTVSVAKDVFATLQADDCQEGELENSNINKSWNPSNDKWIPKSNTWEPKKNLWMPQEPCWVPEEGPWSPKTTPWVPKNEPWVPKNELWMPKTDLWMPKEGQMEKLFEMGFVDRHRNQDALNQCNNFDEVVEQLVNLK